MRRIIFIKHEIKKKQKDFTGPTSQSSFENLASRSLKITAKDRFLVKQKKKVLERIIQ